MIGERLSPSTRTRLALVALFLGPVLFLVIYAVRAWSSWNTEITRLGDYPVVALQALAAERFELFLGPYSRFRFHHPGPLLSYLHAVGDLLFGFVPSLYGRLDMAQFLVNSVSILGGLWALWRLIGSSLLIPIAACLLLMLMPNVKPSVLADIWGPSTLICPLFALVLCAADLARGRVHTAWLFSFCACLLGSTHVGTLPTLFAVGGVGALQGVTRRRLPGFSASLSERRSLLAAAIIAVISAMPPVLEAVSRNGGNLIELWVFFTAEARGHSLLEAFPVVASFASFHLFGITLPGTFMLPLVLLLPWLVWRGGAELKHVRRLSTVALGATLFAATRVRGDLHAFLLEYTVALVALQLLVAVAGVVGPLPFALEQRQSWWRWFVVVSLLLSLQLRHLPEGGTTGERYAQLSAALVPGDVIELTGGRKQWEDIANILLLLRKNGIPVCVSPRWIFMFGSAYSCTPQVQRTVYDVTGSEAAVVVTPRPAPDDRRSVSMEAE